MSDRRHHHRHQQHWSDRDTPMCSAYLAALGRWVVTHHDDADARVVLPVGVVGAEELVRVLQALERSRQELHSTHHKQQKEKYYHA